MALLPGAGRPAPPPPGATIRPVTDDAGRRDYARIMTRAFALYGAPEASTAEHFASLAGVTGPMTQAYLAYQEGRAVTSAVIAEGLGRGARFMSLQASPMGEPMYRRMGFTTPTHYRWFLAAT